MVIQITKTEGKYKVSELKGLSRPPKIMEKIDGKCKIVSSIVK